MNFNSVSSRSAGLYQGMGRTEIWKAGEGGGTIMSRSNSDVGVKL